MIISKEIKRGIFIVLFLFSSVACTQNKESLNYAVALDYTPVLNTPDFGSVFGGQTGTEVKLDDRGLIAEMEFIAFPNTIFNIVEIIPKNNFNIYKVTTNDYQYKSSSLFVDSRFVKTVNQKPDDRQHIIPSKEEILINLKSLIGYPYMWGGNYAEGISKLIEYYPPSGTISEQTKNIWILKGVDCSGLLYQASNGCTLRNTSSLITIGTGVDIKEKTAKEISAVVQPLDLIAWNGHVVIVLDSEKVIESSPPNGVHTTNLYHRLTSIMNERKPVNDWESTKGKRFVIRRFF